MGSSCGEVTQILRRLADGDQAAREELAPHVYSELHKLAAFYLRRERPPHTWQTTELLNEAYLKLVGDAGPDFRGRSHFFGVAAQIMRRILTDHARRRGAEKRGGNAHTIPLDEDLAISDEQAGLIADLDEALQRLEAIHPQAARVVELRFFGGLTEEESAVLLGISSRTVKRLWMTARAWLFGQLSPKPR
jgi:RNA polymerase sigma factor (TIGR02999 family)